MFTAQQPNKFARHAEVRRSAAGAAACSAQQTPAHFPFQNNCPHPLLTAVLPPRWRELQAEEGEETDGSPGSPGSSSEGGNRVGVAEGADATISAESEAASSEQLPAWADGVEAGSGSSEEEGSGGGFNGQRMASLLFYGVRGQQQREGDAPSYFNALEVRSCCLAGASAGFWLRTCWVPEPCYFNMTHLPCHLPAMQASTVVELLVGLLSAGAGVRADDIGVMATYRKQASSV